MATGLEWMKVGVWIARVVLVINLVVRTEKSGRGANAIGIGSEEGNKKRARGLCSGNFRKKSSLQLTRSNQTLPLAIPGRRAVPIQGVPSLPTEGGAPKGLPPSVRFKLRLR